MLISTRGRYALRILIDMAEHQGSEFIPLKAVAGRQDISEKYMENIVKPLVASGLLTGIRGKGGGYRLGRAPEQINVKEVLELMEGPLVPVACLDPGASAKCPRMSGCRTLPMWKELNAAIDSCLSRYTIRDLMKAQEPGNDYVI